MDATTETHGLQILYAMQMDASRGICEVALIPTTGGVFTVDIVHAAKASDDENGQAENKPDIQSPETTTRLWDRKTEGGFPEVKHLKKLVRNIIDPTRDLGHVDRHHASSKPSSPIATTSNTTTGGGPSSSTTKSPSSIKSTSSEPAPGTTTTASNLVVVAENPKVTAAAAPQATPTRGPLFRSATSISKDGMAAKKLPARAKPARTTSITGAELRLDMTL